MRDEIEGLIKEAEAFKAKKRMLSTEYAYWEGYINALEKVLDLNRS